VPVHSKNTKRYGAQGSKSDFPEASTGENPATIERREVAPSIAARSHTERVPLSGVVKQVGHATDGSGRFSHPDYGLTTNLHGSDGLHNVRTDGASGQAYSASGGQFGREQQRPAAKKATGTTRADHGALAGESGERRAYTGGRGPIGGGGKR